MKSKLYFLLVCLFGAFSSLLAYNIESELTVDVSVSYQKVSHQNPWLVGEPFSRKSKAIHLGDGKFFTMSLSAQEPLYAEMDSTDYSVPKMQIVAYDQETGFLLLQAKGSQPYPITAKVQPRETRKVCKTGKTKYIQLPFSKTPIKAFQLEKKESEDIGFSFHNKAVCGIVFQEHLIPAEYIYEFLNAKGFQRPFPHPGWTFDVLLTNSEKKYYSKEISRGVLVTDTFPGIGPAYNLFVGDIIIAINGKSIQDMNDWDRYDRIMDLILRDGKGDLKPIGAVTKLKVFRNHQTREISYRLSGYKTDHFLIPDQAPGRNPLYLIVGGFFFTELTTSYLKEFGNEYRLKSEKKLVYLADFYQKKNHPVRERIVILSRVFPLEGNVGYQEFQDLILETVNGVRITSLDTLRKVLENEQRGYFAFEFSGGKIAIFTLRDIVDLKTELQTVYKIDRLQNLSE